MRHDDSTTSIVRQQARRALGKDYERVLTRCHKTANFLRSKRGWYERGAIQTGEGGVNNMVDFMLALIVTCGDTDAGIKEYLHYVNEEYKVQKRHNVVLQQELADWMDITWTTMGEWSHSTVADLFKEPTPKVGDASDQPDERLIEIKNILMPSG